MTPAIPNIALLTLTAAALLWAAVVDMRERRIPNGAVLALACAAVAQMCLAELGLAPMPWLPPVAQRLGFCAGVLAVGAGCEAAWRALHGGAHGMGMGDIKLAAALALWLGGLVLGALALACVLAVAVESLRRNRTFAFGPYLACSFGACMLLFAWM